VYFFFETAELKSVDCGASGGFFLGKNDSNAAQYEQRSPTHCFQQEAWSKLQIVIS
jgi:hypothetical protein